MAVNCFVIWEIIFCVIFPPIAVLMETGCSCQLLLNIILTILGWLPGMIHAFCVVTDFCQKDNLSYVPPKWQQKNDTEGNKKGNKKSENQSQSTNPTPETKTGNNNESNRNGNDQSNAISTQALIKSTPPPPS